MGEKDGWEGEGRKIEYRGKVSRVSREEEREVEKGLRKAYFKLLSLGVSR